MGLDPSMSTNDKKPSKRKALLGFFGNARHCLLNPWLREQDSNLRPSGYEPDELPTAPSRVSEIANIEQSYKGVKLI